MQLRVPQQWSNVIRARVLLGALGLLPALLVALAGSAKAQQPPPGRTTAQFGLVAAYEQADLYARITGFLKEPRVDIGDRVKKGDLLVELYVPELVAELSQKKALVTQAKVGVEQARRAVLVTAAAVDKAKAHIDEGKASLEKARLEQARWKAECERATKLMEKGVYDRATVDQDLNQLKVAEAGVQRAEARSDAAKASYADAVATRGKAEADLQGAEAGVEVALAGMQRVDAMVEFRQVLAPFDGVVIRRTAATGTLVGPALGNQAKPLFTVARTDIVRLVVDVPELDALAVVPGARATVRFDALEGMEFASTVARTAGALELRSRTLRVEILLANRDNRLLPGMSAHVTLHLKAAETNKKGTGENPPQAPQKAGPPLALLKARLDAAQKTCDELLEGLGEVKRPLGTGWNMLTVKPDEVYTWSVRCLNAQRDMSEQKDKHLAALEEHFKRMKALQKKVVALVPGLLPQIQISAAAWYVAEAEVWLAKEKAK